MCEHTLAHPASGQGAGVRSELSPGLLSPWCRCSPSSCGPGALCFTMSRTRLFDLLASCKPGRVLRECAPCMADAQGSERRKESQGQANTTPVKETGRGVPPAPSVLWTSSVPTSGTPELITRLSTAGREVIVFQGSTGRILKTSFPNRPT